MRQVFRSAAPVAVLLALAACDDFKQPAAPAKSASANTVPAANVALANTAPPAANSSQPAPMDISANVPAPSATANPVGQAIDAAALPTAAKLRANAPVLIKVEVLLDRAHFSPGAIDGRDGSNLHRAITAYRLAHALPAGQTLDPALFQALAAADTAPIMQDYVITADDEKGPFIGALPATMAAQAKLDHLGYSSPVQELAERFHMSQALLRSLNPKADFTAAGTTILVTRPGADPLPTIARVEVDKAANEVRAYAADGQLAAAFPATVGSTERPAPSGVWAVKSVTPNPDYTYDPKRLTFGNKAGGVLTIKPGPNNPVGSTWIALTVETYGIHGAPDPTEIGKNASHGCVRLTNWDAATLGKAVAKGVPVSFVGETSKS